MDNKDKREFLRVDDIMPVNFSKIGPYDPTDPKEGQRENISGGGIKLHSPEDLANGTLLKLQFELPEAYHPITIFAIGEVVWSKGLRKTIANKKMYEVGVKFISIKEADRQKIVRYVFKKQREVK